MNKKLFSLFEIFSLILMILLSINMIKAAVFSRTINNEIASNSLEIFKCGNASITYNNQTLERPGKYIFKGEEMHMKVLVADSQGIDNIKSCEIHAFSKSFICTKLNDNDLDSCNLQAYKSNISNFDSNKMGFYSCELIAGSTREDIYGLNSVNK